jgi:hypothetical protein
MDYYKLYNYISNSDLGALNDALNLRTKPDNIQEIFDFGNLVDTMLTEPQYLDAENFRVLNPDGTILGFDRHLWTRAENMKLSLQKNDFFNMVMNGARFQYVFLRKKLEVNFNGYNFNIPARCKFDIHNKLISIGADIKTTGCTSQKSFTDSMTFFNYDRQGAFYMDLAGLNKMVYFAVSKSKDKKGNYPVFTYAISRNDETYLTGREKYSRLAYQYKHLILNLFE